MRGSARFDTPANLVGRARLLGKKALLEILHNLVPSALLVAFLLRCPQCRDRIPSPVAASANEQGSGHGKTGPDDFSIVAVMVTPLSKRSLYAPTAPASCPVTKRTGRICFHISRTFGAA
jgi:hypothetical protein